MQKNEGYVVSMMNEKKTMTAILYDLKHDIIKSDDEIIKEKQDAVKVMPKESNAAVSKDTMDDKELSQNKNKNAILKDTVKVMLNESNAAVSKNTMDDNQLSQKKTKENEDDEDDSDESDESDDEKNDDENSSNNNNHTHKLGLFIFFFYLFCVLFFGQLQRGIEFGFLETYIPFSCFKLPQKYV